MIHFNENLRNWLLGKNEIDYGYSAVPPVIEESPQELLDKFQKTQDKGELAKINKKLGKLGYEVKTIHVLMKKELN
jgi:hypothetical protein